MTWNLLILGFGAAGLVRLGLIITGHFKDPLLARYEKYGDEEAIFNPLPGALACAAAIILGGGNLFQSMVLFRLPHIELTLLLLFAAFWMLTWFITSESPRRQWLLLMPRWYRQLAEYTSRYERRRLAYLWLQLPLRTRLRYNASDQLFFAWAELVVVCSLGEG